MPFWELQPEVPDMESKRDDTSKMPVFTQSMGTRAVGHCVNCPWFPGMEMQENGRASYIRHVPAEEAGCWLNIGDSDEYSPRTAGKN